MDLFDKVFNYLIGNLKYLDRNTVIYYIDNNKSLLPIVQDYLLKNSITIVKWILRYYWKRIDKYLHDVDGIINIIIKNRPDLKDILQSEKGRKWVYEQVRQIYDFLYKFTWS